MIYSMNKDSNHSITRVALNSNGGVLDLTSATISVIAKQFGNSSLTLFTKTNAEPLEIEVIDETRGLFSVKLVPADTSSLGYKSIYCLQTIIIGLTTFTDTFYIRLKGITSGLPIVAASNKGTTLERPILTVADVGFRYFDTDMSSPIWWNGTEWV